MRELVSAYGDQRFATISVLLGKLSNKVSPEVVHQLRVELKQLRFLLGILKRYHRNTKIKNIFRPFRKLFKQAGEVRGQHVNLYRVAQVDEQPLKTKTHKYFTSRQQKLENRFQKDIERTRPRLTKSINLLRKRLSEFSGPGVEVYINDLTALVSKNLSPETQTKKLHKCRHLLKEVLYCSALSPGIKIAISKVFDLEKVAQLEDFIGDWHDLSILVKKLKKKSIVKGSVIKKLRKKRKEKLTLAYELIPRLSSPSNEYASQ